MNSSDLSHSSAPSSDPALQEERQRGRLRGLNAAMCTTVGVILVVQALHLAGQQIPPLVVYLLAVVYSAYAAGTVAGLATAGLTGLHLALLLSEPGKFLQFPEFNGLRVALFASCAPITAMLVGALQRRARRAFAAEKELAVALERERSRAQATVALQESAQRYRELFEANPHPMWVVDSSSLQFLAVNQAAVARYGYSSEDFLRMSLKDIHPLESVPALLKCLASAPTGYLQVGCWQHRRKDNSLLEVEITGHTLVFIGRKAVCVLALDITERRRAEEALQAATEELECKVRARTAALERSSARLSVLADAAMLIQQPRELGDLLQRVAGAVTALLPASGGASVVLWDESRQEFEVSASTVPGQAPSDTARRVRREGGATRHIVDTRRPLVVPDTRQDPFGANRMIEEHQIKAYAGVPLLLGNQTLGVLYALDREVREYSTEDMDFLAALGQRVAVAVAKVQLWQQLEDSRCRLEALSRHLLQVQERERRHLSRELHDEVGQALSVLKISLHAATKAVRDGRLEDAATLAAEGQRLLDRTVGQVRSISLELRPTVLDDLGLPAALEWQLQQLAPRTGWSVHLETKGLDQRLPIELETTCFRIAQEALTNTLRHARATEVTVSLRRENGQITLTVLDNGCGFEEAAARENGLGGGSMGLLNMRERASLAGGLLRIHSAPGAGTRIITQFSGLGA